jgi:hypothetical protein
MHNKEIEAVSALEPFERYKYSIKKIADAEKFYCLKTQDNNWALPTVHGRELFPIWSAAEFAEGCAFGGWEGFKVEKLELITFQDELSRLIKNEAFLLNIFPVGHTTGFAVELKEFMRDLEEELLKYD